MLFYCTFIAVTVMLSLGTIKNKLLSAFQVFLMQKTLFTTRIFAHAKGLMGKEQCHMVSRGQTNDEAANTRNCIRVCLCYQNKTITLQCSKSTF